MLSPEEIRLTQRLTESIFPGALKARVVRFVLRDMESNPFLVPMYRNGYRWMNEETVRLYGRKAMELDDAQWTRFLSRIEENPFFQFVRVHTLEGMFSDPIYGGNHNAYGWRLIGYAGTTFHPPETLDKAVLPTIYYSLEGIEHGTKA